MADPAFDTLEAARRLKAGGIQAEQADAIVDVVNQSTGQMVTTERLDAAVAALHARIDSVRVELLARIDSVSSELKADFNRSLMRAMIGVIAAITLIMAIIAAAATIFGILLTDGGPATPPFGAP